VDGMKVDELIDLVKAVFQAAQEENTGIQLGYSVAPSYNYWQLNPLAFGGRPPPYSLLKQTMESGVQPDFIGVELQHGTIQVPIDLSTLSETIQAYHDLTGLPILLTEMSSYPSRAEDYGLTAPAPNVYWHAGMTQQAQAEWDTSVFKIAMGLPYGIGVQMVHISPDNPEWGQSLYGGTFIGTDYLDQNREPKQVYDAMQGLFGSWTAQGSAVTGTDGRASFKGLAGDYSVVASTEDGLQQSFEFHFGSESGLATVTFDRTKAVGELRDLMVDAQMKIELFERAGRDLDYSDLRLKLEDARNAFAAGEYAGARNLTSQILDAVRMNIDGSAVDWEGIQPIATAPSGGIAVNAPGTDLKALYAICDHTDLYLMVEIRPSCSNPAPPLVSHILNSSST
jgi:hypothetical protein